MGYPTKKSIHKFFGAALKKNHEHATCLDFHFHNPKFSQKVFWTFVTTATVDLFMKEVIDSLLHRAFSRKIMDTLKAKILTIIVLNLVRKDLSFYYIAIFREPSMT